MRFFLIFYLAINVLSGTLSAQSEIKFAGPSDWVKPTEVPKESKVSKYDVKSGFYYKLIDYQADLDQSECYTHFVYNVLTSGGISNVSQVQIVFDSSYQSVVFHEFKVHRRGQVIDRTNDITFEYIKNEQQLESNIYTGEVVALALLPDIRREDLVEVSYSVIGSNPVFDKNDYYFIPIEDFNPVDRITVRVRTDDSDIYEHRITDPSIEILKEIEDNKRILSIDRRDLEAAKFEETVPPWFMPFNYFEITNTKSWKQVNDWALKLFEKKENDLIEEVFDEIFDDDFTEKDKIDAIIDFVQDEIRYMGIETGIGSVLPFSPNQVITQRFGDCKDKSLLMCTMLDKIGVEAYPALVNSSFLGKISERLVSAYQFDHVIVNYFHNDKEYWIDPTYAFQGGDLYSTMVFDFEKALVVKNGTTGLTDLNVSDTVTRTHLIERLDVSDFNSPGTLDVETSQSGSRADYTRSGLEYTSVKELADYYKSYYSRLFPTLTEYERINITDDPDSNRLVTVEHYTIPEIWKENQEGYEGKWVLNYEPVSLYSYLYPISCEEKKYPVFYLYPANYHQETSVEFPQNLRVDTEEKNYENAAFTFNKKTEMVSPNQVKLTYDFVSKTKEISPEDFTEICIEIDEIIENLPLVFYFSKGIDLAKLAFSSITVKFEDEPLKSINPDFFIDSVRDGRNNAVDFLGFVLDKDKKLSSVRMENGLEEDLGKFLQTQQSNPESAIPVDLEIKKMVTTEKRKKRNKVQAVLTFEYSVSYTRDGEYYEYSYFDTVESDGESSGKLHGENIRKSLNMLIEKMDATSFKKIDR